MPPAQYANEDPWQEFIDRDWGPAPNFAAIWDAMGDADSATKQRVIHAITAATRDRIAEDERQRRINELAERELQKHRQEIDRLQLQVIERARQLQLEAEQDAAAAEWEIRETRRKIDLDQ